MRLRPAAILVLAALILSPLVLSPLALAAPTGTATARTDDVADQIHKALAAYQHHDDAAAIKALDTAANMLRQRRADALKRFLPLPPPGWTADKPQTSAVSASALLGGGTSASRTYHNAAEQVDVQITTDSPMLQSMAALANSPLGASAGVQTATVDGRKVSYTPSDNDFMALIGDKIIVKVDGNPGTSEAVLRSFLASIDLDGLEKLAH